MTFPDSLRPGRLLGIAAVMCAIATQVWSQVEVNGQVGGDEAPAFYVDAVAFAAQSGANMRLDVFTQLGFDALSFVKQGDVYDASYEMTVSILDTLNGLVSEKLWTESVKGVTFERSVAPTSYSLTQRSFEVNPGRYVIRVNVRDLESKVNRQFTRPVLVRDLRSQDFALSDVMLLSKVTVQGERRNIVPSVTSNVGGIPD